MSDVEKDMGAWPNPKVEKDVWTGSIDRDFSPPSINDLSPDGLLYRLEHPETGSLDGHPCQHRGKEMPSFFQCCPFCGEVLRDKDLQGVWLPPYGWAPFSGVPKSRRYHPRPLRNPPRDGLTVPGDGPLRFWILPLADGNDESPSYLFAYRPKNGQIYWLPDLGLQELSPCQVDGDIEALRSNPMGSARNWSVVWTNDHLFFTTESGLLRLRMLEEGSIQVKKVFDGTCLAAPGMGSDGKIYFPAVDDAGKAGIAYVNPKDAAQPPGWCKWSGDGRPSLEEFKDASAPVGTDGGDMHWIVRSGVIVLERDKGRWVRAANGLELVPRAYPRLESSGIQFYAKAETGEVTYCNFPAWVVAADESCVFTYPSGGDGQWFVNGLIAKYDSSSFEPHFGTIQSWPLGSWEVKAAGGKLVKYMLLARFNPEIASVANFFDSSDVTKVVAYDLSIADRPAGGRRIEIIGPEAVGLPWDTLVIPIGTDTVMLYKGDMSASISLITHW